MYIYIIYINIQISHVLVQKDLQKARPPQRRVVLQK